MMIIDRLTLHTLHRRWSALRTHLGTSLAFGIVYGTHMLATTVSTYEVPGLPPKYLPPTDFFTIPRPQPSYLNFATASCSHFHSFYKLHHNSTYTLFQELRKLQDMHASLYTVGAQRAFELTWKKL